MQKSAPSVGKILIAVGFTLSVFALTLFLWISFGGPIPLKPESYRVTAYFPEATQLAVEADVRIGGVSVGKVKTIELAPADKRVSGLDTTEAEIEIEPQFAPISEDARAILRQKTLLGETFVELTSGTEPGQESAPVALGAAANVSDADAENVNSIEEGGTLGIARTQDATQIDEIFNALDEETRASFQNWMRGSAESVTGRGLDLNDAFGNLGPFVSDATEVITILKRQKTELKGLVRDTGIVFEALTERDQELAGLITNSNDTFGALASQERALAEIFQVLPTFQRESRLTFDRLDQFQENTRPLVQDLVPVARELTPTLASLRELSPNLESLFVDIRALIKASREGLPAMRGFLDGLAPVLDELDPFLANLNPVIRYLGAYRHTITDFLMNPPAGLSGTLDPLDGQPAPRHTLRQVSYLSSESLSFHPQRLATNRGNGYVPPLSLGSRFNNEAGQVFPAFDCKNTDYKPGSTPPDEDEVGYGETPPDDVNSGNKPNEGFAPCVVNQGPLPNFTGDGRNPQIYSDP